MTTGDSHASKHMPHCTRTAPALLLTNPAGMHRDARPSGYDGDLPEEGGVGVPAGGGGDGGGMVDNDEHEGDVEHDEHGGDDDDDDDDGDQ